MPSTSPFQAAFRSASSQSSREWGRGRCSRSLLMGASGDFEPVSVVGCSGVAGAGGTGGSSGASSVPMVASSYARTEGDGGLDVLFSSDSGRVES